MITFSRENCPYKGAALYSNVYNPILSGYNWLNSVGICNLRMKSTWGLIWKAMFKLSNTYYQYKESVGHKKSQSVS